MSAHNEITQTIKTLEVLLQHETDEDDANFLKKLIFLLKDYDNIKMRTEDDLK